MTSTHEPRLQGRKKIRPRLRPDLEIVQQRQDGQTVYVVKDPVRLRYFRFTAQEHFMLLLLDGKNTPDDLRRAFEQRYRPQRLSLEDIEIFLRQLVQAGLISTEVSNEARVLLKRRKKEERRERISSWTNLLAIRIKLFDPDRLLAKLLPVFGWLFTPVAALAALGLVLAALLLVAMHFQEIVDKLPSAQAFFSLQTAIYLWLTLGAVKVLHELGHGLTCKAFGGEVHETGLMFLCLAPCLYCEVSDSWMLPSKWRRVAIGLAGMVVELIIAALAMFVWWYSAPGSFVQQLSLCLVLVCGVNTMLFNGNPLLRYDGYFVLADALDMPNLKLQSSRVLKQWLSGLTLGMKMVVRERLSPGRRLFLLLYGITSSIYLVVISVGVYCFVYSFLKPHKLEVLTWVLAAIMLGAMLGRTLHRWKKSLRERGRLPDMQVSRIVTTTLVVASLVACFFLVPLPVSRVRATGLVVVPPRNVTPVYIKTAGVLERLHVRNGMHVKKGDLLAELRNLDLENNYTEAVTDRDVSHLELLSVRERLTVVPDEQRAELQIRQGTLEGEQERFTREVRHYEEILATLQVRAPRDGVIMGLPDADFLGRWLNTSNATPLCRIADPSQLNVVVPVEPNEYQRLHEDLQLARKRGRDLSVALRLPGQAGQTWTARVQDLPASEAREVPLALAQQGGGPLSCRPTKSRNTFVPTQQHYLVGLSLNDAPGTVCPGALATVLIRCEWRPASWWVWHKLSSMFDLSLVGA